jgi:hypothetical protein
MTTRSPYIISNLIYAPFSPARCLLIPNEGWYQNSYGIPGFPSTTFPSSMISFLSPRVVPGSESELLSGAGERLDTITWLGNRPDCRDCGCAGPQFSSATHWENQSTTLPEY